MTNKLHGTNTSSREMVRRWATLLLVASWMLGAATVWAAFALAPVGALATADAGRLVAIRGSVVVTTAGYFHVSAYPSALRGTKMRVIRTNSPWSDGGLQLCTIQKVGGSNWCNDISDGFAGDLSETPFARQAWPQGTIIAILFTALAVTLFGWLPAFAVAACSDKRRIDAKDMESTN